jgi:uncharacterized ion transporter superfamily protein YfcC
MKEESAPKVERNIKAENAHTVVLLVVLAIIAGLLTYDIPAGAYDRVDSTEEP